MVSVDGDKYSFKRAFGGDMGFFFFFFDLCNF